MYTYGFVCSVVITVLILRSDISLGTLLPLHTFISTVLDLFQSILLRKQFCSSSKYFILNLERVPILTYDLTANFTFLYWKSRAILTRDSEYEYYTEKDRIKGAKPILEHILS